MASLSTFAASHEELSPARFRADFPGEADLLLPSAVAVHVFRLPAGGFAWFSEGFPGWDRFLVLRGAEPLAKRETFGEAVETLWNWIEESAE